MTDDLRTLAKRAVAGARISHPTNLTKIAAIKYLREWTGLGIRECMPFVDEALDGPPVTLTRADKERAVVELARRLSVASENYVWAQTASDGVSPPGFRPGDEDYFLRQQRRLNAALVRVAMFRTVD